MENSPTYATKQEHLELKQEVQEGFKQVNAAISNLADNTNKSISKLSESVSIAFQKSTVGDYSVRNDFIRELETKEEKRRNFNFRILTLVVSLTTIIWSAIWWGINMNDDKKRIQDKHEIYKKYVDDNILLREDLYAINKRILLLEQHKNKEQ